VQYFGLTRMHARKPLFGIDAVDPDKHDVCRHRLSSIGLQALRLLVRCRAHQLSPQLPLEDGAGYILGALRDCLSYRPLITIHGMPSQLVSSAVNVATIMCYRLTVSRILHERNIDNRSFRGVV